MGRPLVVVAEQIADMGIAQLREACDVVVAVGTGRAELLELLKDANALIVRSATNVDAEMIAAAPQLSVIGRAGIGVDNIDLGAATNAGVMVVNAPNANTISAAEHTMALLLAQARRVPEADATLRSGNWDRKRFRGVELHGKTLAVLGLGKIGTLVAQRASAFGMRVVAYDPFVTEERARHMGVQLLDLDEALGTADFITIHLPRNRETEALINAQSIAKMRDGVRIINVARGGIVDEAALAEAVVSGKVAGAAIDVFATEPTTNSPLFSLPQVVVTPHLGASTLEAQDKAGLAVADAVGAALRGELVTSAVNLDLGPTVDDDLRPFLPVVEQLATLFVLFARGLPERATVQTAGRIAAFSPRPLVLAAMKGMLAQASADSVSYVNAPILAEAHGLQVGDGVLTGHQDYSSLVRIVGEVGGQARSVAGTILGRKGPVLTEVDLYSVELPLTPHMLLIRNSDGPGVIGKIGSYIGELGINITDMVFGRNPEGDVAMMGIGLDQEMAEAHIDRLLEFDFINAARYIRLPGYTG